MSTKNEDVRITQEQLPFLVNANLAAIYGEIFPHIDAARYAEIVQSLVDDFNKDAGNGWINMKGLYEYVKARTRVGDIGNLSLPFYATIKGYRCCIFDRQTDAASNLYVLNYRIEETGRKAVIVVDEGGESENDQSYSLEDIAPF